MSEKKKQIGIFLALVFKSLKPLGEHWEPRTLRAEHFDTQVKVGESKGFEERGRFFFRLAMDSTVLGRGGRWEEWGETEGV